MPTDNRVLFGPLAAALLRLVRRHRRAIDSAPAHQPAAPTLSSLRSCLQHDIERRLRGTPKSRKTAAADHDVAQARFAGLSPERRAFSRQGYGHAYLRRCAVHDASDRIQVVLNLIVREGLHDHCRAVGFQGLARVPCYADRIAHIVQAVKESDDVKVLAGVTDGVAHLKLRVRESRGGGPLARDANGFTVVVVTDKG